ncbi:hypothetical protein VE00_05679 [Pseudogymnoascus sp. WSF 3629]|nr:hypothetical protein VE00_05679 [Pseudogymnoascus sp. WSF 3629]
MLDRLDDEKYPFLFYDDVVIKLVNGKALRTLRLESRFETKRGWENPKEGEGSLPPTLQSQEDNHLCAIKRILISALRLGALKEKSFKEALASTAARRDKTIQWAPRKGLEDEIKAVFSHLSRLYRRILTTTTGRLTVAKRSRHRLFSSSPDDRDLNCLSSSTVPGAAMPCAPPLSPHLCRIAEIDWLKAWIWAFSDQFGILLGFEYQSGDYP